MGWDRVILHVDMDAFYASVEQRDDPSLRGKPVLVGHDGNRGVVSAASYEARKFGCRSAQPMSLARRLCPAAVILPGDMKKYQRISSQIMAILDDYSPLVEPISIDEAFVDLTGTERLLGPPFEVATRVKQHILRELSLTASVGLAANKFLAKLASDLNKPDGLTVIAPEDVNVILPPLDVSKLWGVGPKTADRLAEVGVRTIGDLQLVPKNVLDQRFGELGGHFHRLCRGLDTRAVTPDQQAKSIGHETTFGADLDHPEDVRAVLIHLSENVAWRLRRHNRRAKTVTVKIRYGDFQTITRAQTLTPPTDLTESIWHAASQLFNFWAGQSFRPVRLVGVSVSQLTEPPAQLCLFEHPTERKQRKLDTAMDAINTKYGKHALRRGAGRGGA
ncbi:MAG TPA: DNA polymerase IV [Tepidisphaeraceae bacterium]|nr:DNA polymerase IV [Tepidisphaeraceae bacterium]